MGLRQHVILEELGKMDGADIDGARPLLTGMLAQVLSAELGGRRGGPTVS